MDDFLSGTECLSISNRVMDEIQETVAKGGFSLRGFTVSGKLPLYNLTHKGQPVFVLGLRWLSERDFLSST